MTTRYERKVKNIDLLIDEISNYLRYYRSYEIRIIELPVKKNDLLNKLKEIEFSYSLFHIKCNHVCHQKIGCITRCNCDEYHCDCLQCNHINHNDCNYGEWIAITDVSDEDNNDSDEDNKNSDEDNKNSDEDNKNNDEHNKDNNDRYAYYIDKYNNDRYGD